jgi:hypothetical protein
MKTTILIKQDRVQLILEPETEHEKEVLKIMGQLPDGLKANFFRAQFYNCQAGYTSGYGDTKDQDLIIVFDIPAEESTED